MMDRTEHIAWCKKRALEYVDAGDTDQAMASMLSDLHKHKETEKHPAGQMMVQLAMIGELSAPGAMRKFIEGFN